MPRGGCVVPAPATGTCPPHCAHRDSAPLLLTAGRFVPGLRFVVNATLGTARYPYPRFLLWSAIGGALWSAYTCVLAYAVGTALDNFPLASVVISGVITTLLLGVIFWRVRRQRQAKKADRGMDVSVAGGRARSDGGSPASGPPAELGAPHAKDGAR
jgi:hypothetical protein